MRPTLTKQGLTESIDAYEKWVGEWVDEPLAERKKALAMEGSIAPCGKGCSKCCELMVTICSPDALRLAKHLKATGRDNYDLRNRLIQETQFTFEMAKGKKTDAETANEYTLQRHRCVFLDDEHGCSVYEARPVVCRLFNTLGAAEACLGSEKDAQKRIVTADLKQQAAQRGIHFGKMAWAPEQGILPEMVLWALETLDNMEKKP